MLGLFLRFLRFGCLAFGGPVAQIAMLKQELVEREQWVTPEEFNRALAVYQVLPGPEATELCVWFGYRRHGRIGGFIAGLGFILPGFLMMVGAAALYVRWGAAFIPPGVMRAMQAVVAALIVRAVVRIGQHAVRTTMDGMFVAASFGAAFVGVPFPIVFIAPALARWMRPAWVPLLGLVAAGAFWATQLKDVTLTGVGPSSLGAPGLIALAVLGVKAGLLTFGGAYTAVPLVRQSAVYDHGWLPDRMFLDGLALGGVLPAPLIIFTAFVGYLGAGLPGAVVMTAVTFAPAFLFTILGHEYFERVLARKGVHAVLDGVAVGVVGLIAATAVDVTFKAIRDVPSGALFAGALVLLFVWKSRWVTLALVAAAIVLGALSP